MIQFRGFLTSQPLIRLEIFFIKWSRVPKYSVLLFKIINLLHAWCHQKLMFLNLQGFTQIFWDWDAISCQVNGRHHKVLPRNLPASMFGEGHPITRNFTGGCDGSPPIFRGGRIVVKHVLGRLLGGSFSSIDYETFLGGSIVKGHNKSSTKSGALRIGNTQTEEGSNGGINGVSPLDEDVSSNFGAKSMITCDCSFFKFSQQRIRWWSPVVSPRSILWPLKNIVE